MKHQKVDKKLLVNTAKGAAGWVLVTSCMSAPLMLFIPKETFAENALLVLMATGVLVPMTYSVSSGKNIVNEYAKMYDITHNFIRNICTQENNTKKK